MLKLFHLQNVYLKLKYLDAVLKPERGINLTELGSLYTINHPMTYLPMIIILISLIPNQIILTASMHCSIPEMK